MRTRRLLDLTEFQRFELHVEGVLDGLELGSGNRDPQYVLGPLLLED